MSAERSRLAQIIASATAIDGTVDRAKVFEGLQLTRDAPEALLLDVFLATDDALRAWRADAPKIEAALVKTIAKTIEANAAQLRTQTDRLVTASLAVSNRVIRIAFIAGLAVGAGLMLAIHFLLKLQA